MLTQTIMPPDTSMRCALTLFYANRRKLSTRVRVVMDGLQAVLRDDLDESGTRR